MGSLNGAHVVGIAKEKIVDVVGHIQCFDCTFSLQPGVDIVIGMTTNMEVARDLLDSEITSESATSVLFETFTSHFQLLMRVVLPQELEILSAVDKNALVIDSVFLD